MRAGVLGILGITFLVFGNARYVDSHQLPPIQGKRWRTIDDILREWNAKMVATPYLTTKLTRTELDSKKRIIASYKGHAMFLRPSRSLYCLSPVSAPERFEKLICIGTQLYEYDSNLKQLRILELATATKKGSPEATLIVLFAGLKTDLTKQFELAFVTEDEHYVYIQAIPKDAGQRTQFVGVRLILHQESLLPAIIEFGASDNSVTRWEFSDIDTISRLGVADFTPNEPAGWKVERLKIPGP